LSQNTRTVRTAGGPEGEDDGGDEGTVDGDVDGEVDGAVLVGPVEGFVDGVVDGVPVTPPVHATPLSVKAAGTGSLVVHAPLNPNDVLPPVARLPL
jgi:hypothetical protein